MENATEILVIITSSVLVICLLLIIIVTIQVMLFLKKIKHLVHKAENVAGTVENISSAFNKAIVPAAIGKALGNVLSNLNDSKKRRK